MDGVNKAAEVVGVEHDGSIVRRSFGQVATRGAAVAAGLRGLGLRDGERVGVLATNTVAHLELLAGVPVGGLVLHDLNFRLSAEELEWTIAHAEDRVLIVDPTLREVAAELDLPPCVGHVLDLDDLPVASDLRPEPEPSGAASLCYTSGTTGRPKGVAYSHAALGAQSLGWCLADTIGLSGRDRLLLATPQFHANGWGLPVSAFATGAALVLPGRIVEPSRIAGLIRDERVTVAAGVPTIWADLLRAIQEGEVQADSLASLERIVCGGSAVPPALLAAYDDLDVELIQVWGMTETGPLATVSRWLGPDRSAALPFRSRQGRPVPFVELGLCDDGSSWLPHDGVSVGEVVIRGPWVIDDYAGAAGAAAGDRDAFVDDGSGGRWLRTGDVGRIHEDGTLELVDRSKDLIKSGGEWISSVAIEAALQEHPAVRTAAVVARPDDRWMERPVAWIELAAGADADDDALRRHLGGLVSSWQVPDAFVYVDALPRTSVGKLDKRQLRARSVVTFE